MGAPSMKTLKELIKEEREAVATMLAMRENYQAAQNNLDAAERNLSNARIALDMALEKSVSLEKAERMIEEIEDARQRLSSDATK